MNIQGEAAYEPIEWITANVDLRPGNSAEFLYDRMASQSNESLPVIYQAFDGHQLGHFVDRGQILDFVLSTGGGRVLDFGPGDGWPSLLIAPMVDEVVGVDGSQRRTEVCARNAARLGLGNVRFVHVSPGRPLPFSDCSFDAATASSSVEQTPDPEATLKEIRRVLKPGERLRMHYASLEYYHGGAEREMVLADADEHRTSLLVFDRNIEGEYVRHCGLLLDLVRAEVEEAFGQAGAALSYAGLAPSVLGELCRDLVDAVTWTTQHPSCRTLLHWLREIGFHSAKPTYDGGWFARRLFERLPALERPVDMDAVDELLRPLVEIVIDMEAPSATRSGEWDPWVTAVR